MLSMIRTACNSIEAALSSDEFYQKKADGSKMPEVDQENFLTQEQEDLVGQMLGLLPEKEQDAPKKPQGKRKVDEKRMGTDTSV